MHVHVISVCVNILYIAFNRARWLHLTPTYVRTLCVVLIAYNRAKRLSPTPAPVPCAPWAPRMGAQQKPCSYEHTESAFSTEPAQDVSSLAVASGLLYSAPVHLRLHYSGPEVQSFWSFSGTFIGVPLSPRPHHRYPEPVAGDRVQLSSLHVHHLLPAEVVVDAPRERSLGYGGESTAWVCHFSTSRRYVRPASGHVIS